MLHDDEITDIKVFLRTYNDAVECAQSIASRESQRDHYKQYVKTLIRALKDDKVGHMTISESPNLDDD